MYGAGTGDTDPRRGTVLSHMWRMFAGAMGDQGIGQRGSWATPWSLHQPVKKFGLDPECVGGSLSPTPILCNSFTHQTQACLEILKPLGLKEGGDVGGSFLSLDPGCSHC